MDDPTTTASEGFGLMFYNARWYDVALGRFTQPDTIIPEQTQGSQAWDRYAYVNNNPVRYADPSGHDVGCAGQDAGECAASDAVIIACGQNETCGYDTDLMNLYYQRALDMGSQVYFYNNGDFSENKTNKYDMATAISAQILDNPDVKFTLAGHSAGADALIYANFQSGYADNIKGTILLEPSMNITLPDKSTPSLQTIADRLPAGKFALALSEKGKSITINDRPGEHFPGVDHNDLATVPAVFYWAFQQLGLRR